MVWREALKKRAIIKLITLAAVFGVVTPAWQPVLTVAQAPPPTAQPVAQDTLPWSIHLYAVPTSPPTGTGLFAFTGQTGNICRDGKVTFSAELLGSPTPFEGEYDPTESIYTGFLDGFFPDGTGTHFASLEVVCLLSTGDRLATTPIIFWRYPYRNDSSEVNIPSNDNLAELTLNSGSLSAPHSIIVMATNALPGPLPGDVQQIGLPYSFRASGGTFQSNNNMLLNLFYQSTFLGEVNPLTLRIFEWDTAAEQWLNSPAQSLSAPVIGQPNMNKLATKFTTYVLGSTPLWHDSFTSSAGLETQENVTRISAFDFIKLDSDASSGFALSKPYTPTLPLGAWQEVTYEATIPANTALTVSLLSPAGEVLLADIPPTQSLAAIDPHHYPSLKLRVEMSTPSLGTTPELHAWSILAKPVSYEVYLPLVVK